ncbi:MAG TPA: hypothetical protein PKW56_10150 [Clostridiales bacterium]|nr:hypothetical protein [Clostridiales bacterium]
MKNDAFPVNIKKEIEITKKRRSSVLTRAENDKKEIKSERDSDSDGMAMVYLIDSGRALFANIPESLWIRMINSNAEFTKYMNFVSTIAINKARLFDKISNN